MLVFIFFLRNLFLSFSQIIISLIITKTSGETYSRLISIKYFSSFFLSFLSIPTSRIISKKIPKISILMLFFGSILSYLLLLFSYFYDIKFFYLYLISTIFGIFSSGIFEIKYRKEKDINTINRFLLFSPLATVFATFLYLTFRDNILPLALLIPFSFLSLKHEGGKFSGYFENFFAVNKEVLFSSILFSLLNSLEIFPIVYFANIIKEYGKNILVFRIFLFNLFLTVFWFFIFPKKKHLIFAILFRIFSHIFTLLFLKTNIIILYYIFFVPILNSLIWVLGFTSVETEILKKYPGEINFFHFINQLFVGAFYFISSFFFRYPHLYFFISIPLLIIILFESLKHKYSFYLSVLRNFL